VSADVSMTRVNVPVSIVAPPASQVAPESDVTIS
jgi:hypothetical protein